MALNSTHTKGVTLKKSDGASPEVYTTIGGVTNMPQIMSQKSILEDTSIADDNRHHMYGIGEPPSFTLTVFWDEDNAPQTALIAEHENETESNYQLSLPNSPATTYTFKAIIFGYSTPYGGINELFKQDFTFQLNENDDGAIITKA